MKAIGRHIILEMWGCSNLDSVETADRALREMVVALDVNLLDLKVYPFSPVGVTGMALGGPLGAGAACLGTTTGVAGLGAGFGPGCCLSFSAPSYISSAGVAR